MILTAEFLKLLNDAVNIAPQKTEAYIRMLDYYCESGQTGNGLRVLSSMRMHQGRRT